MPDFQGQFIPDGRTQVCKGALTIRFALTVGILRMRVSDEERRHLEDVYTWIRSDKYCGPDPDKEL